MANTKYLSTKVSESCFMCVEAFYSSQILTMHYNWSPVRSSSLASKKNCPLRLSSYFSLFVFRNPIEMNSRNRYYQVCRVLPNTDWCGVEPSRYPRNFTYFLKCSQQWSHSGLKDVMYKESRGLYPWERWWKSKLNILVVMTLTLH